MILMIIVVHVGLAELHCVALIAAEHLGGEEAGLHAGGHTNLGHKNLRVVHQEADARRGGANGSGIFFADREKPRGVEDQARKNQA